MQAQSGGSATPECFLCSPNQEWIWLENDHFFAMVALGPIVAGMTLIASRDHIESMFDLPVEHMSSLDNIMGRAMRRLTEVFNLPVHITEHGRVGLCEVSGIDYDSHCKHAHRLLFPVDLELETLLSESIIKPILAKDFQQARSLAGHLVEYLFYQDPTGAISVGAMTIDTPRQFFRGVFANSLGRPELQSWRSFPQEESLNAIAKRLRQK